MSRTHIFHIADIHIHLHNHAHIAHAWKQLIDAIISFPNYKTSTILAIAGDVFDHKIWLQADDIALFNAMMSDLERNMIRTIMMPGNHDYNINQPGRDTNSSDKILALVKTAGYQFITHCSLSQIVTIDDLAFFIHSPIDLGTPRPSAEQSAYKKIAMVHEPLTNARTSSGITFQSHRFSAANFAPIFDITLLGDIHMPQKLAQNVAYAGSFVQKNRGEGLEHGYFLWEVAKNNGKFIEIPQLSVHIKVNANNNTPGDIPLGTPEKPIIARSIQLHHTSCTEEWVRKFASTLQETYKKPIDGVYNKDKISTSEIKHTTPNPTANELDVGILSKLNASSTDTTSDINIDPKQKNRVIAIHQKLFEDRTNKTSVPGDWRIRHLSWSNLYCYGEDNWFDFDSLDNLNSIIGPNKTGKSSIIDILILVLFNETVRGAKKCALNANARTGHIKCIISVGNDVYSIERAWIDINSVVVRLYKNGTNISGSDMPATYQILEGIIGSKRVFINTAIALQQRQFLVDLSPKERYELVCRMIDLDRLRAIEDENRVNIRVEKKLRATIGEPVNIMAMREREIKLREDIEALNTSIASCSARMETIRSRTQLIMPDSIITVPLSCAEISHQVNVIENLGNFNDQNLLESSIAKRDAGVNDLDRITRDISYMAERLSSLKQMLKHEPNDITFEMCNARINEMSQLDITSVMSAFSSQNAERSRIESLKSSMLAEMASCVAFVSSTKAAEPIGYRPSIEIDAELASLEQQEMIVPRPTLDDIPRLKAVVDANSNLLAAAQTRFSALIKHPYMPNETQLIHDSSNQTLSEIEETIKVCQQKLVGFVQSIDAIARLKEMTTIHSDIFHWSEGCDDCCRNRGILGNTQVSSAIVETEITRIESCRADTELELRQALGMARMLCVREIKQLASVVKIDYNQLTAICKRRDAADSANRQYAQLSIAATQAKMYESTQVEADQKSSRIVALEGEINTLVEIGARLETEIASLQTQLTTYQSLDKLRESHAIFVHNLGVQQEITRKETDIALMAKTKQLISRKLDDLNEVIVRAEYHKSKIRELDELTKMFAMAQLAEDARDEIATLTIEANKREIEHKSLLTELARMTHALGMLVATIATSESTNANIAASEEKLADMELYDRIINHKTGIPVEMMRSACARIQQKCNEVFEQIADFRIGVVFDDEVHLNVISANSVVNAEQSSGYQKFIIDIIMRQVLCSLTATGCPRILFVDEGFGSADESNFSVICRNVLPLLSRSFEKVIVISHIAGIHEYTTGNIAIKISGEKSKLNFGPRDVEKLKLRVIDDHTESQKLITEEKEARKAADKIKRAAEREHKKQEDKKMVEEQIDTVGENIFTRVDLKTVKCDACNKVYKETSNFTTRHIASAAHIKNLASWLKTNKDDVID